jgi:hypothetical protein
VVPLLRRQRLTRHTSACFRSRAPGPVSGQLYDNDRSEDRSSCRRFPVTFQPPAFASWASCSRHGVKLSSRSAYRKMLRTVTGFPRSTRVRHGRVGCPLNPGGDGIHTTVDESSVVVCRLPAASLFVSPAPLSDPESCRDEASTRVHHIHPFGLPLTCNTQSEWVPLGFSLSFAPGNCSPRTSERGPVSDTDRELRLGHQTRPPIDVLTHFVRPRVAPQLGRSVCRRGRSAVAGSAPVRFF